MALFTIITQTGYLLVAQIRPHLTLFLSLVMCHFALISSLVLLLLSVLWPISSFPQSVSLTLSFYRVFFPSFFPALRLSFPADLFILALRVPSYQKAALFAARNLLHCAQCVKPASNIMNYNGSIHGAAPAAFCAEENTTSED